MGFRVMLPLWWPRTACQRARLLAATTHGSRHRLSRHRHVDMVQRMVARPDRPIVSYPKGRRAVVIERGAHIRHGQP